MFDLKIRTLISGKEEVLALPIQVLWYIWLAQNAILFQGKVFSPLGVYHKLKARLGSEKALRKEKQPQIPRSPTRREGTAEGRFDGAAKDNLGQSDAGGLDTTPGLVEGLLQAWSGYWIEQSSRASGCWNPDLDCPRE